MLTISSALLILSSAAILQAHRGPQWLEEGRLPMPISEGANATRSFRAFLRTCSRVRRGNTTNLPEPKSLFSKVPSEWTSTQNQTLAAAAKKYEGNFQSLSGNDVAAFYNDLCPYLRMPSPEALARIRTIRDTCKNVRSNTLNNLTAPNLVWDPQSPMFQWIRNPNATVNGTTNSTATNGTTSMGRRGRRRHGGRKLKALFIALANVTNVDLRSEMRTRNSTESRLALKRTLLERLGQPWNEDQKAQFWKAYCSAGRRGKKRGKKGKKGQGLKDKNGNALSAGDKPSFSFLTVSMTWVILSLTSALIM